MSSLVVWTSGCHEVEGHTVGIEVAAVDGHQRNSADETHSHAASMPNQLCILDCITGTMLSFRNKLSRTNTQTMNVVIVHPFLSEEEGRGMRLNMLDTWISEYPLTSPIHHSPAKTHRVFTTLIWRGDPISSPQAFRSTGRKGQWQPCGLRLCCAIFGTAIGSASTI